MPGQRKDRQARRRARENPVGPPGPDTARRVIPDDAPAAAEPPPDSPPPDPAPDAVVSPAADPAAAAERPGGMLGEGGNGAASRAPDMPRGDSF